MDLFTISSNFLFIVTIAFLQSDNVMCARWRQARDVFLSNLNTLSNVMKREPSHMIMTRDLFGLTKDEDLKITDTAPSVQGTNIKKYHETYGGIPVFDATLTVETDATTDIYTGQVTGKLVENLDEDIASMEPNVTENEALQLALMYGNFPIEGARIDSERPKLEIYVKDDKGFMVYRVVYFAVSTDQRNFRFCMMINAQNGELIDKWNMLETAKRKKYQMKGIGGNRLIGKHEFGNLLPYLKVRQIDGKCYFMNKVAKVVNLQGKTFLPDEENAVYHVDCKNGSLDEVNGGYSPANDALFYGNVIYDMYMEWVKVPPKKYLPMVFRVHYSKNTVVASFNGNNFTFSDGNNNFLPLVSLDVVAHEVSHCFTEEHSNLVYVNQSGAIDESFSDLAGEAAENFEYEKNDWGAGGGIADKPLRYLCNQSQDGRSIEHVRDYKPDMDVHYSSGVFNHFYCNLANSNGWDVKKVFQVVAHANRFYWHPKINFTEAACDIMKSTYDLGYETGPLSTAFEKVGIVVCDFTRYVRTLHGNSIVEGLSSVPGEKVLFKLKIKSLWNKVKVLTYSGSGEVDLYVCYLKAKCYEHLSKWRSNQPGTDQLIVIRDPTMGKYYVILKPKTRSFFTNVTIKIVVEEN